MNSRPVLRDSEEGLWRGVAEGVLVSSDFSPEGKLRLSHTVGSFPPRGLRRCPVERPFPCPVQSTSPPGSRPPSTRRPPVVVLPTADAGTQTSDDKLEAVVQKAKARNAQLERQVKAAERLVRSLALYLHDKENLAPASAPAQ
jgi:hypothetical protein